MSQRKGGVIKELTTGDRISISARIKKDTGVKPLCLSMITPVAPHYEGHWAQHLIYLSGKTMSTKNYT